MDNAAIFDEVCSNNGMGNRLDIENFPDVPAYPLYEATRAIATEFINDARTHVANLPEIHFDFTNSPVVNAVAFAKNGHYFVGVTAGAINMLYLVLTRMLASPHTFPNVGNASGERTTLPDVPWAICNPERLFQMGVRAIPPQDEKRLVYALHLADQAAMFLVGHEIAHITRGHVDYLSQANGSSFVTELGWHGTGEEVMERQVIEVDADGRSVYARCKSMFMTANANQNSTPFWAEEPGTIESYQYDWLFAVNALFRLFGDERFSGTNLGESSYPPLPMRRRIVIEAARKILLENWGREHEETIGAVMSGVVNATDISFQAIGASSPGGGFAETQSVEAVKHMIEITRLWGDVKERLRPFSYETL